MAVQTAFTEKSSPSQLNFIPSKMKSIALTCMKGVEGLWKIAPMAFETRGSIGALSLFTASSEPVSIKWGKVTISLPVKPFDKSGRKMNRFFIVYEIVSFASSSVMSSRSFHSLNKKISNEDLNTMRHYVTLLEHIRSNFRHNRLPSTYNFFGIGDVEQIDFESQRKGNFFEQRSHLRARTELKILWMKYYMIENASDLPNSPASTWISKFAGTKSSHWQSRKQCKPLRLQWLFYD